MATSLVPNDQPEVLKLEKDLPLKSASVLSVEEEIAAKDIPKDIVNAALASVPELAKRLVDLKDSIDSLRTLDDQALKTKLHARRDNENDDDSSDVSEEENDETQKTEDNRNGLKVLIEAIPEARRCNQDTFFNRYTPEDGLYAIEYLVAGPELAVEIEKRTQKSADAAEAGPVKASKGTHGNVKSSMEGVNQSDKAEWIQRVRINSQAILKALDRVNDGDENNLEHSVTIWRPFSPLIHYHEKMKAELERIEKERLPSTDGPSVSRGDGEAQAIAATNVASTINDKSDSDKSLDNTGEPGRLTGDDVTQLRCFVNFMEEHILPDHLAPRQADDLSPPKVRFDDLWYLFRPGDLVHVPIKSDNERAQKNNTSQTFFRVAQMTVPDAGDVDTCFDSEGICKTCERRVSFCLSTYRIDYDGEAYRAVERLIVMKRFHGEKDVTKLAVFPARFLKDKDAVLQDAIASGKNFHHHIKYPQGFYNGWTLTHTPTGEAVTDEKGDIIKKPKHIESDVILDFGEAFRSSPKWKPDVTRWSKVSNLGGWTLAFDHVPIRQWDNNKRKNQLSSAREYVVSESGIYQSETNAFLEHDQFLLQPQGQAQGEQPLSFSDEDYILLPRRMFAYSLWQRSFVQIDSHYLSKKSSSQSGREPFEELSIKPETKTVIESLVKSHFRRQKAERDGYEVESQDLIRGKGKGTVILLHGVPGVGKTATAEAIAQKWKKPLFPITCGDLGFTADSVENSLNEIFRLAHLWDCILLFDEADVFITQRDGTNLKKNALVSGKHVQPLLGFLSMIQN